MHLWCYILHGILFALHVVLILLSTYHPEHKITMSNYNTWMTIVLAIFLQAFYVVRFLLYLLFYIIFISLICKIYSGSKNCPNVCMFFTKCNGPQ